MIRATDWEQRLNDYLAKHGESAFQWGKLDCALFAAGAVRAMTHKDPAHKFRGKYKTARGSVRALKRFGAGNLELTIADMFEECPPAFARRGDLALVDGELGVMIGVVTGDVAVFIGDHGLERRPMAMWRRCWRVG